MGRHYETLHPQPASSAPMWPDPKQVLRFYLNICFRFRYIPRVRPSRRPRAFGARVGFSFNGDRCFADKICPEMKKPNSLPVILTSANSTTYLPQTSYKTLTLTRLLKETTVPLTLSVLPHKVAQTLLHKNTAMTAFPLHRNNGKGPVE